MIFWRIYYNQSRWNSFPNLFAGMCRMLEFFFQFYSLICPFICLLIYKIIHCVALHWYINVWMNEDKQMFIVYQLIKPLSFVLHFRCLYPLIDWLIDWFIHSFIHSCVHSCIHSFTHALIHSLIHLIIHSFIPFFCIIWCL